MNVPQSSSFSTPPSSNHALAPAPLSTALTSLLTATPLPRTSSSLVFIDSTVANYKALAAAAVGEVYILNSAQDATTQITQVLQRRTNISSLQIVSYGQAGGLQFGGGALSPANLLTHATQLQSWQTALTPDADILLYGCNVAQGEVGKAFVQTLGWLTGADVAASDDRTGNAAKGGDWVLEFSTGEINSASAFESDVAAYGFVLDNTAPNLIGDATLAGVEEDIPNPMGASLTSLFSDLFDDPDENASLSGLAIVGNETSNLTTEGEWQYSTNNGVNWFEIGAVNDSNSALALSASTLIRFNSAPNYNGVPASLQVRALDDTYLNGFTADATRVIVDTNLNGDNTSISEFTSVLETEIFPVNDAPTFTNTKGDNITLNEGAGRQFFSKWADDISAGPDDEFDQFLTFEVSIDKPELFDTAPEVDSDGNLTFELKPNANGAATVTVKLKDDDGIDGDGVDTSDPEIFTITVTPVNNSPELLGNAALAAVNEDTLSPSGATVTSLFTTLFRDADAGSSLSGVAIVGDASNLNTEGKWQYSADNGANWLDINNVSDGSTALALSAATLVRFVPVLNYNGTPGGLRVRALDNTYSGEFTTNVTRINVNTDLVQSDSSISETASFLTTSINAVNDAPSFTKGNDIVVQNSGFQSFTGWATAISAGASNETGQQLTFEVSTNDPSLFEISPSIDSSGNLSFKPKANINGTAIVMVKLQDDGGTANGGQDTSTVQSFPITVSTSTPPKDSTPGDGTSEDGIMGTAITTNFKAGKRGQRFQGDNGKNRFQGTKGNDILLGNNGNDQLLANSGNDRIKAGKGNDQIKAGKGDDLCEGGAGNDRIFGDAGKDILVGGAGNDILVGGAGKDMLVFAAFNEGVDAIQGFEVGQDVIDLRSILARSEFSGTSSFDKYQRYVQLVQVGANTEVRIDADGSGQGTSFVALASFQSLAATSLSSTNFVI